MSLAGLQCALADLFTSPQARARYGRDPAGFATRYALNARNRLQLDELAQSAVAAYALTLIRKRRSEAARLLPRTRALLAAEFGTTFEGWASERRLRDGKQRHSRDAIAFCRYLQTRRDLPPAAHASIAADLRALRRPLFGAFRHW